NPYLPEPILFVALDVNGGVVGTRGFHGTQWHTPDEKVVIPCAEDFTIAADHQNTGLATAIMRFALEDLEQRGYEYVMSASGGQVTVLHSLAMGWKSLGAMEPVARLAWGERARHGIHQRSLQAVRRLWRPGRRSRTFSRRLYGGGKTSFGRLDRVPRKPAADPRAAIVVSASPDPAALADVAGRRPFDGRIRHVRDPAFFEWRFENPSREYRFLLYELDGRLEGFMAIARYHSYHPPTLPFHIVDWEGSSHEVRADLLEFAVAHGGFDGFRAWTSSLPDESKALLAGADFRPVELELRARGMPCVLLKKLGASGDRSIGGVPAIAPAHWDIRLIDSMSG
ncbi:MAG: hypothetical protein ACR2M2_03920, partial [Gaiellaceae bacterium]